MALALASLFVFVSLSVSFPLHLALPLSIVSLSLPLYIYRSTYLLISLSFSPFPTGSLKCTKFKYVTRLHSKGLYKMKKKCYYVLVRKLHVTKVTKSYMFLGCVE